MQPPDEPVPFTLDGAPSVPATPTTPDYSFLGTRRDEMTGTAQAMLDPLFSIAQGFNSALAETAGGVVDFLVVGPALELAALADPDFDLADTWAREGGMTEALKTGMERMGMPTEALDNMAYRMGKPVVDALIAFTAMYGAGGLMGAVPGATTVPAATGTGRFAQAVGSAPREVLAAVRSQPGLALGTEVAASMGAQAGDEKIGGPLGGMVGAMVAGAGPSVSLTRQTARVAGGATGGLIGGGAGLMAGGGGGFALGTAVGATAGARVGRRLAERVLDPEIPTYARRGWDTLRRGVTGEQRPAQPRPLRDSPDPVEAKTWAEEAVKGDIERANADLRRRMADMAGHTTGDTTASAERLWRAARGAYKAAQANAQPLWNAVDKRQPVAEPHRLFAYVNSVRLNTRPSGQDQLPGDVLKTVKELRAAEAKNPGSTTVEDLLNVHSTIQARLREGVDNGSLRRNYVRIDQALMNALENTDRSGNMQRALAYTRWTHNTFTRGALGQFVGLSRRNPDFLAEPARAAMAVLRSERGGRQLADAAQELARPALVQRASAFAREHIGSLTNVPAEDMTPAAKKALQWANSPQAERFIRNFEKQWPGYEHDRRSLNIAMQREREIQESAFTAFAGEDSQRAVASLFSGSNRIARVRQIMDGMTRENAPPEAAQGLRNGVIDYLYQQSGGSPKRMAQMLDAADYGDITTEVLGYAGTKHLRRILTDASRIEGGVAERAYRGIMEKFGRISGAQGAKDVGLTALQSQSIGAGFIGGAMRFLVGHPPANVMLSKMLTDARYDKYIRRRMPENLRELRAEGDYIRSMITGTVGADVAFEYATQQILQEGGEDENPRTE